MGKTEKGEFVQPEEWPRISRTLTRYGYLQRFNVFAFYAALLGVFSGLAITCAGFETTGTAAGGLGMSLLAILIMEKILVIPLLKCPSCEAPFFTYPGALGLIAKLNPHNRNCVNCGLSLDASSPNANTTRQS